MADDSSKGNVIKGPWKKAKRISQTQTEKVQQDMVYVDDVAESVMIPMIHGLAENGVDIKSDRFITEVGFINESIRALLFRHLGYKHTMSDFIKHIMVMEKAKTEDLYASFNDDLVDKMNKVLEEEKDKKDE
tara:strand:- start:1742 stop:2137 length:396 start_codon:yes stop_codon:yes gene_type:complete